MYNIKYKVGQKVYCLKQKYREYSFHIGIIQEIHVKNVDNFIITKSNKVKETDISYDLMIDSSYNKISQKLIIGVCPEENEVEKYNKIKKEVRELIKKKENEIKESTDNLINKLTVEIGVSLKENS